MAKGVSAPAPPAQPTATESLREWVELQPEMYAAEEKYAPQYAQLYKAISEELYPETAGLQEQLSLKAREGMGEDLPAWAQEEYRNRMAATLGENIKSGIGADYMSTGMLSLKKGWQDYYTNLGLTTSGRQPLATPSFPTQGVTPQSVMSMDAQTYAPYMSGWQTQQGIAQQQRQYNQMLPWMYMSGAGNLMSGIGGSQGWLK